MSAPRQTAGEAGGGIPVLDSGPYFAGAAGALDGLSVALRAADEEVVEHILRPFYTTKGVSQCSGLGLSMV
jgi:hypothetical protein